MSKLICELDGKALCIKGFNFRNIVESPCMFLDMSDKQIKEFNELEESQ